MNQPPDQNPRVIALFLQPTIGYFADVVTGLNEYAKGTWWVMETCPTFEVAEQTMRLWKPDGILVNNDQGDWPALLKKLRIPAVQVGGTEIPNMARISTDNYAIGHMAAQHFIERGFRQFGFCGYESLDWSRQREAGYRDALSAGGFDAQVLLARAGEVAASAVTGPMAQWVLSLPKPCAVFACHDRAALLLAKACQYLHLRVPEDLAILGVDNNIHDCGFSVPPLSSIMGSARRIGYEAAALLHGMIMGKKAPTSSILVPPAGVVVRRSTDVLAVDDPDLAAALKFIRQKASGPLDVTQIAQATLISRRLLEQKFQHILGRTPRQEILRVRIEWAKTHLVSSTASTLDIALRTGFPSASKFSAVFKRETGLTPTDFRRLYSIPL